VDSFEVLIELDGTRPCSSGLSHGLDEDYSELEIDDEGNELAVGSGGGFFVRPKTSSKWALRGKVGAAQRGGHELALCDAAYVTGEGALWRCWNDRMSGWGVRPRSARDGISRAPMPTPRPPVRVSVEARERQDIRKKSPCVNRSVLFLLWSSKHDYAPALS
jgi:hypothetical protein